MAVVQFVADSSTVKMFAATSPASAPVEWTRRNTTMFITCLREHPCFWKVTRDDYKDRDVRNSAVKTMISAMRKSMFDLTSESLKKKWNTLRTQYRKEHRLVLNSKKSGAGTADFYVPKLWCYDQLSFLDEADVHHESVSSQDTGDTQVTTHFFCAVGHTFIYKIIKILQVLSTVFAKTNSI